MIASELIAMLEQHPGAEVYIADWNEDWAEPRLLTAVPFDNGYRPFRDGNRKKERLAERPAFILELIPFKPM